LCVLTVVALLQLQAGVGEWRTFTSKREIRDVARQGAVLWGATSGGLFRYDGASGAFAEFTTSEGLKTIDLTDVAADGGGDLWIGAANGTLHRYSPRTGAWRAITDIALLENPQKRINGLRVSGDTLFILSDVGLSLYSITRSEFGDTYARFGADPGQISGGVTSMEILDGTLWVGTRSGVASTPVSNPNPSSPDSWQVTTAAGGLPASGVTALAAPGGTLCASTSAGIAAYASGTWSLLAPTSGLSVVDMMAEANILYCVTTA
jgi:ligand-binding sensor domain-containing protein